MREYCRSVNHTDAKEASDESFSARKRRTRQRRRVVLSCALAVLIAAAIAGCAIGN